MSLDRASRILLQLAGTVALPGPPPAGAAVEIVTSADEVYLRVIQHARLTVVIRWTVELRHVRALAAPRECFPPDSPAEPWPVGGGWALRTGAEVARLVRGRLARTAAGEDRSHPWLAEAVIFVPEAAPVLRQAEAGLTAIESVEYLPEPFARFGEDARVEGSDKGHCWGGCDWRDGPRAAMAFRGLQRSCDPQ